MDWLKQKWEKSWLKQKWGWIVAGVVAIISIVASKKRDSKEKIENSDLQLKSEKNEKIAKGQEIAYKAYVQEKSKIQKDFDKKVELIAKNQEKRRKELENNPEELDKILKEKYKLKGE